MSAIPWPARARSRRSPAAARNVTVNVELDHLGASEVSLVQPLPMFRLRPRSLQVQPGDLYATSPLDLCFTFRITDASAAGPFGWARCR